MKADIILEADRDLYYISHIQKDFTENRGIKDTEEANNCTLIIVSELISRGYCSLATWGKEKGSFDKIILGQEELLKLIARYNDSHTFPFDFFLITTEKGKEWVARYMQLLQEL